MIKDKYGTELDRGDFVVYKIRGRYSSSIYLGMVQKHTKVSVWVNDGWRHYTDIIHMPVAGVPAGLDE